MTKRFVPPPNWPASPPGWQPPAGWRPDPRWGPAPYGWQFWQEEPKRSWFARHKTAMAIVATPLAVILGLFGLGSLGPAASEPAMFANSPSGQTVAPSPTSSEPPAPSPTPSEFPADSAGASASTRAEANAKAAAVRAAKVKAAAEQAAKLKAAKLQAAKAKAAKAEAAKAKAKAAKAKREAEDCTTGYSPCLPWASDYDCAGGSGNGPEYVDGSVRVTGSDPYDLDRNGDGIGCES